MTSNGGNEDATPEKRPGFAGEGYTGGYTGGSGAGYGRGGAFEYGRGGMDVGGRDRDWGLGDTHSSGFRGYSGGDTDDFGNDFGQYGDAAPRAGARPIRQSRGGLMLTTREEHHPNHALVLLAGIGIGAALMYFLDSERGAERRQAITGRALDLARSGQGSLRDATADLRSRAGEAVTGLRERFGSESSESSEPRTMADSRAESGANGAAFGDMPAAQG